MDVSEPFRDCAPEDAGVATFGKVIPPRSLIEAIR